MVPNNIAANASRFSNPFFCCTGCDYSGNATSVIQSTKRLSQFPGSFSRNVLPKVSICNCAEIIKVLREVCARYARPRYRRNSDSFGATASYLRQQPVVQRYTNNLVTPPRANSTLTLGIHSIQKMACPERFELPTSWFVAMRSIQLGYGHTRGIAIIA